MSNVAANIVNPNPSSIGFGEDEHNERTIDWVQRRFGPPKEVLNVTMNQSCLEVPSQTIEDSSKAHNATIATIEGTTEGNTRWSKNLSSWRIFMVLILVQKSRIKVTSHRRSRSTMWIIVLQ